MRMTRRSRRSRFVLSRKVHQLASCEVRSASDRSRQRLRMRFIAPSPLGWVDTAGTPQTRLGGGGQSTPSIFRPDSARLNHCALQVTRPLTHRSIRGGSMLLLLALHGFPARGHAAKWDPFAPPVGYCVPRLLLAAPSGPDVLWHLFGLRRAGKRSCDHFWDAVGQAGARAVRRLGMRGGRGQAAVARACLYLS